MTDRSFLKYMNTYQNYKNMKKQKVWLITGASRGFGLEIAKAALKAGDKVVATVRSNPEQFEQLFPEQQNLSVVVLDVTQEKQVIAGVEKAIATFGGIDVLVNNAGYGLLGAMEEITDQEVRSQFDTNVFGLLNVTRAVLPYMRSRQKGHIINISSRICGYGSRFRALRGYKICSRRHHGRIAAGSKTVWYSRNSRCPGIVPYRFCFR